MPRVGSLIIVLVFASATSAQQLPEWWTSDLLWNPSVQRLLKGEFAWTVGEPLVAAESGRADPCHAIKDPSIVQSGGKWHLFCTIRSATRTHQIAYLSFDDWQQANAAPRHVLRLSDGYFCAPQVFYFTPQKKWYLIHQISDPSRKPALQPAFSTNDDIANPEGWSAPQLLFGQQPANVRMWIDFWVICDEENAYLFYTSMDGLMWRSQTALADFPHGWSTPKVALKADIFEAAHVYALKGLGRYLALVEAQDTGRRYYKAYLASSLDGGWQSLADTARKPFASPANIRETGRHWAESISHGELVRASADEKMEVDPTKLRFVFQGVLEAEKAGKNYGQIPWRLGVLEMDQQ